MLSHDRINQLRLFLGKICKRERFLIVSFGVSPLVRFKFVFILGLITGSGLNSDAVAVASCADALQ